MECLFVLLLVTVTLVVCSLLRRRYDTGERIDKGIELFYWKLSYRRKFIRTLWMIPLDAVVVIGFHTTYQSYPLTCVIAAAVGIVTFIQAVYNYRKWKNTALLPE